jgi:hypothetical protein
MWLRTIGVELAFIEEKSPLWHVEHEVLVIHHFDHQSQANYLKRRRDGAKYLARRMDRQKPKKNGAHPVDDEHSARSPSRSPAIE